LALAAARGRGLLAAAAGAAVGRRAAGAGRAGLLVHDLRDAVGLLLELLERGGHRGVVLLLDGLAALGDHGAERGRVRLGDLVLVVGELLLELVAEAVQLVAALDLLAALLVLGLVLGGLL